MRVVWVNSKENWIPIFLPLPRHYRTPHSWFQPKLRRIGISLNSGKKLRKHNMFALADYFWLKWRIRNYVSPKFPLKLFSPEPQRFICNVCDSDFAYHLWRWFCAEFWIIGTYIKKHSCFLWDDSLLFLNLRSKLSYPHKFIFWI